MSTWRAGAEDPRGIDELVRDALAELDLSDEELPATAAVVALQCRPTRAVLDRACDLCRSGDVDERRLGVLVPERYQRAEYRDEPEPPRAAQLAPGHRRRIGVSIGSPSSGSADLSPAEDAVPHRQTRRLSVTCTKLQRCCQSGASSLR